MKKYFIVSLVSLLVGLGLGYPVFHNGANQPLGGGVKLNSDFTYGFTAGLTNQLTVSSAGALTTTGAITGGSLTTSGGISAATYSTASVGASSSSPAALGSAAAGHFVVAAGATTANASTTAVTANSGVFLQVEQATTIAGTTCNTTIPTTSPVVSSVVAGNGFTVKVTNAPVTNPLCLAYRITN